MLLGLTDPGSLLNMLGSFEAVKCLELHLSITNS